MAKNMHRYIEYISLFVDCIVLPLCVRLPYMLCSSPWQVSHSSGISNILGSSTQSRLHLHSFTGSHTGIPLTYTWPPHSHNTLRHVGLWDSNSDLHASVARASPRVMANAAYQLYRIRMLFINFTGSGCCLSTLQDPDSPEREASRDTCEGFFILFASMWAAWASSQTIWVSLCHGSWFLKKRTLQGSKVGVRSCNTNLSNHTPRLGVQLSDKVFAWSAGWVFAN